VREAKVGRSPDQPWVKAGRNARRGDRPASPPERIQTVAGGELRRCQDMAVQSVVMESRKKIALVAHEDCR